MITSPGFPSVSIRAHNAIPVVSAARAKAFELVTAAKVDAEKHNRMVYFQSVPSLRDLPELPAGIV